MKVLAISFGRQLFDQNNAERTRMQACAETVDQYHMIIFTRSCDQCQKVVDHNKLWLHPTASKNKMLMLFDAYKKGQKIISENGIDVITAQNPFEAGFVAWFLSWRNNIPLNIQEHGDNFSEPFWRQESITNRVRYFFGRRLLLRAHSVRVVAKRIVDTMMKLGAPVEKILYVPVRTDVLDDELPEVLEVKSKTDIVILSMARFECQKNLPLLIRSFAKVVKKYSAAKLHLVGQGSLESNLKKLVHELNIEEYIIWQKWTEEPSVLLQSADIYALSSDYEGWGRVLIEAMAYGLPIVTTDVGCAGEVVKDGVHGYVVEVRNENDFSKYLEKLVANPALRTRFGQQARSDVGRVHISLDKYAERWCQVLKKTVELSNKD